MTEFENSLEWARAMDERDPLRDFRSRFHIPRSKEDEDCVYFAGNSLGLQPRKTQAFIEQELQDWARLGVEGHFHAKNPWLPYHENVTGPMAEIVGAKSIEVVVMNSLTVNLHLMLVSFYRPTPRRFKILIEGGAFPSDRYAVESQIRFHGLDPESALIELEPRPGEEVLHTEDILKVIRTQGDELALVLLGSVNYLTGQAFDIEAITKETHIQGAFAGFDLAHGAGNLLFSLHDWKVDFAVWCSYKYLNAGPGGMAGCFVHETHAHARDIPRFAGWWGHDKASRFQMPRKFNPIPGAEGWQLSNPPIFQMAALRASLEIFKDATMPALRKKSEMMTGFLEFCILGMKHHICKVITPSDPAQRGGQLSLRTTAPVHEILKRCAHHGIVCDFREPDIMRATPVPLYNSFQDVYRFAKVLADYGK